MEYVERLKARESRKEWETSPPRAKERSPTKMTMGSGLEPIPEDEQLPVVSVFIENSDPSLKLVSAKKSPRGSPNKSEASIHSSDED